MFKSDYLVVFTLIVVIGSLFCLIDLNGKNIQADGYISFQDSLITDKNDAFLVLKNKCNACHKKENKSNIFTLDNMNIHAKKINKQVFIKGKMPKDDVKLSEDEYSLLKKWLDHCLDSSN